MRAMSSAPAAPEVTIEERGKNVLITLNRPSALNALNLTMIRELTPLYKKIHAEGTERVIVMKGAGEKAFCAGGDVRSLYDQKLEGKSPKQLCSFFEEEYELNQLIGTLPANVSHICLLNGITMGGGVGLSVHGRFRVACEKTLFAMPETALGFFPDVGGSHFLSRLRFPGLGMYLALTGARLKGGATVAGGISTHFCESKDLPTLEAKLLASKSQDEAHGILAETCTTTPEDDGGLKALKPQISHHFTRHTIEKIITSLLTVNGPWEKETLKTLAKMSPTALKVTHRQIEEGAKKSFVDCFKMELSMAEEFMSQPDFFEGVRSILVDKDRNPTWSPPTVKGVTRESVDAYFTHNAALNLRKQMAVLTCHDYSGRVPGRFYTKF